MKIKIFTADQQGNIIISKKELEELLNEAYWEGYKDSKPSTTTTTPYYTWSTCGNGATITTLTSSADNNLCINSSDLVGNSIYLKNNDSSITLSNEVLKNEI